MEWASGGAWTSLGDLGELVPVLGGVLYHGGGSGSAGVSY